ncbi:hypothetical protein Ciccas_004818 [Cichlidogyrus casuarinus]|uniref:Uncharacterized protein n=1 Tax=Cichlidogyrus casuarinus TaxID=1844966 RepID=A0ABD2QAE4_9PLAT
MERESFLAKKNSTLRKLESLADSERNALRELTDVQAQIDKLAAQKPTEKIDHIENEIETSDSEIQHKRSQIEALKIDLEALLSMIRIDLAVPFKVLQIIAEPAETNFTDHS